MATAIHHERAGEGPPLVLLHGVGHHLGGWRPVVELLGGEFDTLACDSPGFGRSPALPAGVEPSVPAYADAFERFFEELNLDRPHVAGNSMGGGIAFELARRGAVRSVSAFSPVGFWTPRERLFCSASLTVLARTPHVLRPAIRRIVGTRPGRAVLYRQLWAWPLRMPREEALSALDDAWSAPAFIPALSAFGNFHAVAPEQLRDVPITVAWGNRDRLLLYGRQAPRARRVLAFAEHVTLGAGHLPAYDDPPAVAQVIRACAARAAPVASPEATNAR